MTQFTEDVKVAISDEFLEALEELPKTQKKRPATSSASSAENRPPPA